MSQTLLRTSLTAALTIASFGVAAPVHASLSVDDRQTVGNVPVADVADWSLLAASAAAVAIESSWQPIALGTTHSMAKVGSPQVLAEDVSNFAIATIYAHDMDGRSAATVYVRNIPTFTFLSGVEADDAELSNIGATPMPADAIVASDDDLDISDPVVRATVLAAQINQYYLNGGEAAEITVRWNDATDELLIEAADAWALAMDSSVIFPETTGELAEDALHATNMLRRQLGDAAALTEVEGLPERPVDTVARATFSGMASWYGPGFHGRMSASGERFDQNAMTAAHRTLPFGTLVEVTNLNTGASAIVRINDRGPYSHGRVIDLSAAAARAIGMFSSGVAPVSVAVLE